MTRSSYLTTVFLLSPGEYPTTAAISPVRLVGTPGANIVCANTSDCLAASIYRTLVSNINFTNGAPGVHVLEGIQSLVLTNVSFSNCVALDGAGITAERNSEFTCIDCLFTSNTALPSSGGTG